MRLPPFRPVALCCAISALVVHTSSAALENYWPLDEFSGQEAFNLVPDGVTGLLFNGPTWVTDPIRGQVLQFDGIDDFVDAGMSPLMTLTNDYTWSFWSNSVLPPMIPNGETTTQNNRIIIGNRHNGTAGDPSDTTQREFLKFTQTNLEFHRLGAANNVNHPDLEPDRWYHTMAIKQGASLTYFLNGHFAGRTTLTDSMTNPQPFYMGGNPGLNNTATAREGWQGKLDDVATWTNAMPLSSVVKIAKGTATPATAETAPTIFAPVFVDDFSTDSGQWYATDRGLEQNGAQGGYDFPTISDGKLTLGGTAKAQYWYGKSLETAQYFDSTVETIISVDRVSLSGSYAGEGTPATPARYRSSLWLFGDVGHYLHFSQVVGEGGWAFNANDVGGAGTLTPTGGGTNIPALDAFDSDLGQHTMALQIVPSGIEGNIFVYMLFDGNIVASHEFTNFPQYFQVVLTGQARQIGDMVAAEFDNFVVAQAVPEPSTALLLGVAALGAFGRRRRGAVAH